MDPLPKVSVLMAAYNRSKLIAAAIESFLDQTYPNAELLICDDCSTDNTIEIIKFYANRHSNIRWFRNDSNKKFLPTINWLFDIADGAYICICDSDDMMTPDRIEHQVRVLRAEGADAIISAMIRTDEQGVPFPGQSFRPNDPPVRVLSNSDEVMYPSGSLMMHKRVQERVKGYNLYFSDAFCGDIYFLNAIAAEFTLIYDPRPVYYYRVTSDSMTQTFNLYALSKLELSKKLIKQRRETGTDLLEQGDFQALERLRVSIECDRRWKSEQFRMYAARAVDEGELKLAAKRLSDSLRFNAFSPANYRTLFYFLRRLLS